MWFVKHFLSKRRRSRKPRFYALGTVAVFVVLLPSISTFAALVTTDRYIVGDEQTVTEDQYVTASSGQVEGVIDGDLTIFSGSLTITGKVTGSVTVFSVGSVTVAEGASIAGSLRGSAGTLHVAGTVGSDVFAGAASIVIDPTGVVGRDVLAFGGALTVRGDIGRDIRGRTMRTEISGDVGGDVDIATQGLDITSTASVGGDVLYRSPADADIDDQAQISGTITRLPTRGNFIYGIILSLATVVSLLGFIVTGIAALWALRASSSRAVGAVLRKPIRSLLVGLVTVIVFPAVVLVLAMTLVGLPLAAIGVLIGAIAFIIGPVPVVTALGNRVLLNRGGLFGAFVVGAILWGVGIWLIPLVGGFVYLIGLIWGIGAWVMGLGAARRADPVPAVLLPASMISQEEVPADWEPPLAPQRTDPRQDPPVSELEVELEPITESDRSALPPDDAVPAEAAQTDEAHTEVVSGEPPTAGAPVEDPPEGTDSWGLPK
jgi:cytoskeletal protein CcmA (bactofilin family)